MEPGKRKAAWKRRLAEFIVLAIWFAFASSAVELAGIGFRTLVLGQYVERAGTHLIWMIPTGNAALFLVPALILAGIALANPEIVSYRVALSVFASLFALDVLLLAEHFIYFGALLALSVGLGLQAGRVLSRHEQLLRKVVDWTLPIAVAAVLVASVSIPAWRAFREWRGEHKLAAAPDDAPNLLLIILDTVRWKSLHLTDTNTRISPELARWSRSGVVFEHAIAPAPWTLPSHASMFTGYWAAELPAFRPHGRKLGNERATLAAILQQAGYATAGFTANRIVNRESGLARGFLHFEAYPRRASQVVYTPAIPRSLMHKTAVERLLGYFNVPGRKSAADIRNDFFDWTREHRGKHPFFAFLNFFDAHAPYLPPPPFDTLFDVHGDERIPVLVDQWSAVGTDSAVTQNERKAYLGAIAYLDSELGALLDRMQSSGLLDSTVVIITADHGEEIGEHGRFGHGQTLYTEIVSVPLLIIAPGRVPAGVRVQSPVSLVDLPSTILAFAGVQQGTIGGRSLRNSWKSGDPVGPVWSGGANRVSVVDGEFHYILGPGEREELFDHNSDPGEHNNLVSDSTLAQVLQRMRRLGSISAPDRRRNRSALLARP